jgi:ABC-2 type transport system permease protein
MIAVFTKYKQAFILGLQSNLVYRWNFLARGVFSLLHLVAAFILWGAIFTIKPTIGGFNLAQTITYFITLIILQFFIGAFNEDFQISEEIRNGLINQFILKPINYYLYRFSVFIAARLVSGALVLIPLIIILPWIGNYLALPHELWRYVYAMPAMVMAAIIQFTIAYCFGMLSFWFLDIQGFVILSFAIETALGGQTFPLDLMPKAIFHIAQFLPFFYQMYFPAAIITGRIGPELIAQGFIIQAFWVLFLLIAAQLLWIRGLKRHTAVGG